MDINNNTTNQKISIELCVEELENFPQINKELLDVLEIEAQNTESAEETAIVLAKEKKEPKRLSVKHIFQSFFYAMQWPQLKRQLTKEAFQGMAKRHWPKATVGSLGLALFLGAGFGENTTSNYHFSNGQDVIAASVVNVPQEQLLIVSEDAKNNYIARFAGVAQGEMSKFGIPASILLGMAVLHSNYGASELSQVGHNHFHITCSENPLAEGITGRDMYDGNCYIHYQNAWTGFRANSLKLNTTPYETLKTTAGKDYKAWITGLAALGYPETDELQTIIENHELYQFDQE